MKTLAGEGRFRDLLAEDPEIAALLPAAEIDRCFDLDHALAHTGTIIDRAIAAD
jgi:adenylosuccinate lyase